MGLFNRTNRKNYVATPSAESDPDLTPHSRTVSSTSRETNDTDVPSMWARVRSGPPGAVLARPVVWSLDDVCFTVTEMIRNTLPDSGTLPPGVDKYMFA